jgi:hypothetical protein
VRLRVRTGNSGAHPPSTALTAQPCGPLSSLRRSG